MSGLSRRTMLTAPALLSIATAAACAEPNCTHQRANSKILVAYPIMRLVCVLLLEQNDEWAVQRPDT